MMSSQNKQYESKLISSNVLSSLCKILQCMLMLNLV